MPKISVLIITYNRSKMLAEAIESVLDQSFADLEIVVVDDNSSDNTRDVMRKFMSDTRIKYFRNEKNLGMTKNRNYGIGLTTAKYVAILDSDDLWCNKKKLQIQFDYLESHPDHALVGGGVVVISGDGLEKKRYLNPENDIEIRQQMLLKNPFANSSVLFLKQAVVEAGLYNESSDSLEDYDLWLRIGKKWKLHNIPNYVLKYRVHGNNISILERKKYLENNVRVINIYKVFYPNYCWAWLRRTSRLWAYKLLDKIM